MFHAPVRLSKTQTYDYSLNNGKQYTPEVIGVGCLSFKKYFRAISISTKINDIVKKNHINFIFTYDNDQLHINPFISSKNKKIKIFNSIYGAFFLDPKSYENEKIFLKHAKSMF